LIRSRRGSPPAFSPPIRVHEQRTGRSRDLPDRCLTHRSDGTNARRSLGGGRSRPTAFYVLPEVERTALFYSSLRPTSRLGAENTHLAELIPSAAAGSPRSADRRNVKPHAPKLCTRHFLVCRRVRGSAVCRLVLFWPPTSSGMTSPESWRSSKRRGSDTSFSCFACPGGLSVGKEHNKGMIWAGICLSWHNPLCRFLVCNDCVAMMRAPIGRLWGLASRWAGCFIPRLDLSYIGVRKRKT